MYENEEKIYGNRKILKKLLKSNKSCDKNTNP